MNGLAKTALTIVLVLLWLCAASCGRKADPEPAPPNSVVTYLRGAELQAETDEQRQEVLRALNDLLKKSPAELRNERYSDYAGHPGARNVVELLTAHFVPPQPAALDAERFYADISSPEARSVIQAQRDKVQSVIPPVK